MMARRMSTFARAHRAPLLFLAKMTAVYGAWYLLYEWWLHPAGAVDAWMAEHLAAHGGWLLRQAGLDPFTGARALRLPGAAGVLVADACNGIETLGLFVGFVVAFPGRMSRRLLFVPAGLLLIYAANAARVAVLAGLQRHWPLGFEALHSLGTMFFYLAIFLLWVAWVRYGGDRYRRDEAPESGAAPPPARAPQPAAA